MEMLTHRQIWLAIDMLAEKLGLSASGLARQSGLDPTSFNPSKRFTSAGRERWPSTESIAKILKSTGTQVDDFMALTRIEVSSGKLETKVSYRNSAETNTIPLIGFAQAGNGGFFDDAGFPAGHGWDVIDPPMTKHSESCYALTVSGDSMMPLYRDGDTLVVDPALSVKRGDRVVAKSVEGEVFAKVLAKNSTEVVELVSLNPEHPDLSFKPHELEWVARIIWASQ